MINQYRVKILSLRREYKTILALINDFFLIQLSFSSSLFFITGKLVVFFYSFPLVSLSLIFGLFFLFFSGVYRTVVRFINFDLLWRVFIGNTFFSVFLLVVLFMNSFDQSLKISLLTLLLTTFFITTSRVVASRLLLVEEGSSRVAIYGAGSAGIQLAGALRYSTELQPVFFVDKNTSLHGTYVGGMKVIDPSKLKKNIKRNRIDEVLIAIPSAPKSLLKEILKDIENFSIKVRILPGVAELAQGKIEVSELKEVEISDLLGRTQIKPIQSLLNKNINNKVVLITGAGGSVGSELARQVLSNGPKELILLDSNELSLYLIKQELDGLQQEVKLNSIIGNVTNFSRIEKICKTFKVETIYHAAAYKHVPLVEENPFEGVLNNIFGTLRCVQAAIESKVETFVFISTDKAVRPTNIMGATKRFAELILQSLASDLQKDKNNTIMTMVRFGNVLGSSGSALPLFKEQIKAGGPLTVTHPDVTRYFMTITEAAELVIQAGAMAKGGEVFVLDMGEPVKVLHLAKRLIRLSGMDIKDKTHPNGDIEITFTGLRPGEKLYEELLIGDNVLSTDNKRIFKAEEDFFPWYKLKEFIQSIEIAEINSDNIKLIKILAETVSGFKPEKEIADIVYSKDPT